MYTVWDAAWYLGIKPKTFWEWVRSESALLPTAGVFHRGQPSLPFVSLAEGMILRALRHAGLTMPYIRKVLKALREDAEEHGIDPRFALASKRLHKHGSRILVEYGDDETRRYLEEAVSRNKVFPQVVEGHLERITYGDDGWVSRLILPPTKRKVVVVDPLRASGQALTIRGGARIVDIVDRYRSGDTFTRISKDFAVPEGDVDEIIRAFYSADPEAADPEAA
jgi:uncharacterized protein (DUF433 family)